MKYIQIVDDPKYSDIQQVILSRPQVKNAFHPEMIAELTQYFKSVKNKKCIFLSGEGGAFCAGADLNWMKDMVQYSFDQNIKDSEKLWEMFDSILNCQAVVVGVAHGAVFGGGLGLLAVCDYVFAEEKTKFCFSEVKLGLSPAVISSFVLRKCNLGQARALMLSAEVFHTEKAMQLGLVHQNFSGVKSSLAEFSDLFSVSGTEALAATKKLLNQLEGSPSWAEQKSMTTKVISERRISKEAQEKLKFFLDGK